MRRKQFGLLCLFSVSALMIGLGSDVSVRGEDEAPKAEKIKLLGSYTMSVPAEFKRGEKGSRILDHEFKVTLGEESARLTMMMAGGSVEENIKRWERTIQRRR